MDEEQWAEPLLEVETPHGSGCSSCEDLTGSALKLLRKDPVRRSVRTANGVGAHWAEVRIVTVPDDASALVDDVEPSGRKPPFWRRWR